MKTTLYLEWLLLQIENMINRYDVRHKHNSTPYMVKYISGIDLLR